MQSADPVSAYQTLPRGENTSDTFQGLMTDRTGAPSHLRTANQPETLLEQALIRDSHRIAITGRPEMTRTSPSRRNFRSDLRRLTRCAALLVTLPLAGGCALPFAAGVGVGEVISLASLTGTIAYNKGASDLALDIVTGGNCRIVEGLVREDRKVCEEEGSDASERDFKGVVGVVQDDNLVVVGHELIETRDGIIIRINVFGKRAETEIAVEL